MPAATLFERVTVVDPGGPHDGRQLDLLVDLEGRMRIGAQPPDDVRRVACAGLHLSPGWVDVGAGLGEPGFEQRETVRSLQAAAAIGGYTQVFAQPLTDPVVDDSSAVKALLSRATGHPVRIHAIGALSRDGAGEHLAELADMSTHGVTHVSDGLQPVDDPKLLELALTYAEPLNITVCTAPGQRRLTAEAQVHEGLTSTLLGLRGFPAMAESIGLQRDLELLAYRGGSLHVLAPSLASSIDRLRGAKRQFSGLSYGVSVLHLLLTDEAALGYDRDAKLLPPLRSDQDRARLLEAVRAGEADALLSLHRPLTAEESEMEFAYADFGAATIEVAYGIATAALGDGLTVARVLGARNRSCVGLPQAHLAEGGPAELTCFLPEYDYSAPLAPSASLAANPAVPGRRLRGLPVGVQIGSEWLLSPFADAALRQNDISIPA